MCHVRCNTRCRIFQTAPILNPGTVFDWYPGSIDSQGIRLDVHEPRRCSSRGVEREASDQVRLLVVGLSSAEASVLKGTTALCARNGRQKIDGRDNAWR